NPFSDVANGEWYTKAIIWAAQNGIVNGIGEGKFAPTQSITREQMAAILYRYADYKDYDTSAAHDTNILSYKDYASISKYAVEAMQWACGEGLITGMTKDTLAPKGGAIRAQSATILARFCETVAK
ncbi:MAG: S-layer homology domain-containing protein, partial [Ruminiclostridium sp.]|nr:S-layer homology domain-containing protein [Ruminiclostridium sp.]